MTTAQFFALFLIWMAAIASPGPDLFQIIRRGSKSRSDGIWTAIGIMVGNTFWIVGSLLGLSALIASHPVVLSVLQLVGGAYLTWMGYGAVRSWWRQRGTEPIAATGTPATTSNQDDEVLGSWAALRTGIATNLSNPKAVLFFGSVFAQFIKPEMGFGWSFFIAAFLILTGVLWFVGFAILVRKLAAGITRYSGLIDLFTGVIFVGLGMFMIVEGVMGIGVIAVG
ncbi:LysE family translocator [Corynebacterium callunae]|uniref:LysE family translocator n=1 Tax=Corynebacterium callunae TaxID=1721 RepID=UPI0039823CED